MPIRSRASIRVEWLVYVPMSRAGCRRRRKPARARHHDSTAPRRAAGRRRRVRRFLAPCDAGSPGPPPSSADRRRVQCAGVAGSRARGIDAYAVRCPRGHRVPPRRRPGDRRTTDRLRQGHRREAARAAGRARLGRSTAGHGGSPGAPPGADGRADSAVLDRIRPLVLGGPLERLPPLTAAERSTLMDLLGRLTMPYDDA